MSISHIWEIGKGRIQDIIWWFCLILGVFLCGFILSGGIAIWYLQRFKTILTIDPAPPGLQLDNLFAEASSTPGLASTSGTAVIKPTLKLYVASKRGKSYYSFGCKAGDSIAKANRVWFSSRKEAEAAGYAPSKSCKDLK